MARPASEPTGASPSKGPPRLEHAEALLRDGEAAEACRIAQEALASGASGEPRADALALAVRALHALQRYPEALTCAQQLAELRPSPQTSTLLAQALHFAGRSAEALRILDMVVASHASQADAWRGRGLVLLAVGRAREAVEAFDRVLSLVGPSPDGLANRASALQRQGDARAALRDLDAALRLAPEDRRAHVNRIGVLMDLLRLEQAREAAEQALRTFADDAELHWNLGLVLLLQGELPRGWEEHEWRRRVPGFRAKIMPWPQPEWRGEDLRGRTILLFAEQGFGDTLQMIRFVPVIAARAKAVHLLVPPNLERLLQDIAPNCRTLRTGEPVPVTDFQCALPSIPAALQLPLADIPAAVPYVSVDPERVAFWKQRLAGGQGPAIGLVWSGNPMQANDHNRSMPLQTMRALAAGGCRFVSLQPEIRPEDRAAYESWPGLLRWGEELRDFADTAALVSALDVVVTVCTSVAHLAGALGRPAWILLTYNADWRWLVGRSDSPWYPSARLFRQPSHGNWAPVLAVVRAALERAARPSGDAAGAPEAATARLRAGNAALAAGDLAGAAAQYREAVALTPDDAAAHVNLGYALLEQGQVQDARAALERAAGLGGGADAPYFLGQAHAALGDWSAARDSYLAALVEQHDFGFAWRDLGVAQEHLGDRGAALGAYENAVRHAPELIDAVAACARLQMDLGDAAEAVPAAQLWVQRAGEDWQSHLTLGQALLTAERPTEALASLDRAAALADGNPTVAYARGNVLFRLERFAQAVDAYREATAGAPQLLEAQLNLGISLDRIGRFPEALDAFDRVLALEPDHKRALYHRPMTLMSLDRIREALEAVALARRLRPQDPDMEWFYSLAHLLAGRLEEGWPAYEARWRADTGARLERQAFPQPLWTGQPLAGKSLLVYPEQGLGDVLQLARVLPLIEARGARVQLWSPATLAPLLATVSPGMTIVTRVEELPPADFQCPIMSLPLALGITLETIPAQVPYLHADAGRCAAWKSRLGEDRALRVGLVWSGNPKHANDHNRSLPLDLVRQLQDTGCRFVSLQPEVRQSDRAAYDAWPGLLRWGEELRDFGDTAALVSALDLVITVDTSVAHLAGALGRPLWVLLPYRPDWRWMLKREDSPWYPTARLFRQGHDRAWQPVVARVRSQLAELVASRLAEGGWGRATPPA